MPNEKVKRLMDFRKRTYALLSMQASLEGSTIIDIVERAVEKYANPSIKEIINSEYGEWEERSKTKKSGRPRTKNKETQSEKTLDINETEDTFKYDEVKEEKNNDDNMNHIEENNVEDTPNNMNHIEKNNVEDTPDNEEELTDEERKLLECYR